MSFQALARTWRPRRFDQVVGQEHVVRALSHALDEGKLHHALLFSGTRGVGKTTLARIIAKCLNCEHGVTATPCAGEDACTTCREIDEGRYVDLIEVDAASRTGVDDTRELMNNVQYAPTQGRTKVYLIDEVHMLTRHSFNALLKTLEEPPPRVQFLLATTEPEKIPVTILSRCLQFPLKRLSVQKITGQLRHVVDAESLTAEDGALAELARGADGSMRDGLSLLDQAIAFGGGRIVAGDVRNMLGTVGEAKIVELVDAITDVRSQDALDALDALYAQGIDMRHLLDALATTWQHIATLQVLGEAVDEDSARWQSQAERLDPRQTQVLYDITMCAVRDYPYAPEPLVGVRMAVLRMLAFAPAGVKDKPVTQPMSPVSQAGQGKTAGDKTVDHAAPMKRLKQSLQTSSSLKTQAETVHDKPQAQPVSASVSGVRAPVTAAAPPTQAEPVQDGKKASTTEPGSEPAHDTSSIDEKKDFPKDWQALIAALDGLSGFAAQLVQNATCRYLDPERVELEIARSNAPLATDDTRKNLQQAIARVWPHEKAPHLGVKIVDQLHDTPAKRNEHEAEKRQQAAVASMESDPIVQQLRDRLGAQLRPETVKPNRQRERDE